MPITLTKDAVAAIMRRALNGRDHSDIVDTISTNAARDFFQLMVYDKIKKNRITLDWYQTYLSKAYGDVTSKGESSDTRLAVYGTSGLYNESLGLVRSLEDTDIDFGVSARFGDISIRLNMTESLVAINGLMAQRIGVWNAAGQQVEAPLMETLCRLFEVEPRYFTRALADDDSLREVDYYLIQPNGDRAKCEVKLMGRGNPESADAIHARETDVFVASTLSDTNKRQLDEAGVLWTELQVPNGFLRFQKTLGALDIPHTPRGGFSDDEIESAVNRALAL